MQIRNFNSELMFASILFSRLFRNITILRALNKQNTEHRTVPVNCVIGNRSRIFKHLDGTQKKGLTLPLIVVTRTGISINSDRNTNLHNEVKQQTTKDRINYNLLTPVPIDIEFTVTLVSRWPSDIDMMLSNIIPFFNQDVYVACRHPKYYNVQYFSQVVMGGNIQQDAVTEISTDQDDIVTATLTFTFKTYIFGGNDQVELATTGGFIAPITKISPEMHAIDAETAQISQGTSPTGKEEGKPWRNEWDVSDFDKDNGTPVDWDIYFQDVKDGSIPYPAVDTMRWVIGIDQDGGVIVDPNIAYGYKIGKGDGLAEVPLPERPYAMMNDTTHDNYDLLGIQNHQRMPYVSRVVRPYTQEEIDAANGNTPDEPPVGPDFPFDPDDPGDGGGGPHEDANPFGPSEPDPHQEPGTPSDWGEGIPDSNRSMAPDEMEVYSPQGRTDGKRVDPAPGKGGKKVKGKSK